MYVCEYSVLKVLCNLLKTGGHFIKRFVSVFSLTTVISYWNPCIWLAESKFVSEKHWQNAWWNAPLEVLVKVSNTAQEHIQFIFNLCTCCWQLALFSEVPNKPAKYKQNLYKLLKKSFAIQVWLIISLLLSHFLYYHWYH